MADKSGGFVRKHFFINRKMQGRYMLTFLVPMLVMLVFLLFTLYVASQSVIATTTTIIKEEIENKTAMQLQDQQQPTVAQYSQLIQDIQNYIRDFSGTKNTRRPCSARFCGFLGSVFS